MPSSSRTALVEDLMGRFPEVPREAVIKEDLLRGGMAFDESALSDTADEATGGIKPKSY
ncbi:radical SAM protein, partial [Streptomyces rubiginosohelvolus]